jgi:pimeloyl-ACP methyl ester carboxylesterase
MRNRLILLILAFFSCGLSRGQEIIRVRLTDGETISGRLCMPANVKKVKAMVIFIHGTGPNTYLNKRKIGTFEFNYYDLFANEFNKRGIAFFSYDRRGVTIGETAPIYDKIDSLKYLKYTPLTEASDVESIIARLKEDKRLNKAKTALLGASEGTMVGTLVADRKIAKVDALLLFGYVNDNLFDIIKWQLSGVPSIINIRNFFDKNEDNIISRAEYESADSITTLVRSRLFRNASFAAMDMNSDSIIDYRDFGMKTEPFYQYLMKMISEGNDKWIWDNYFRVTIPWLEAHRTLETNKTRMLRLTMPIWIFQGLDDGNAPLQGVYDIKNAFAKAGKTNLTCTFYKGHNHDMNYMDYPIKNVISEGLQAIFKTSEELLR